MRCIRWWPAVVLAVICAWDGVASAKDDETEWLAEHAVRLKSIDPADEDISDLAPLAEAIGDARVVALGEQTHGDGATFLAKCRLVKFLHQELGFDVLAFESGVYDCHEAWKAFVEGKLSPQDAAAEGVFGIWTQSAQVLPLFDYLAKHATSKRPLELCGFDCQFTGRATKRLSADIDAALKAAGKFDEMQEQRDLAQAVLKALEKEEPGMSYVASQTAALALIELSHAVPTSPWPRTFRSLIGNLALANAKRSEDRRRRAAARMKSKAPPSTNTRDTCMARSLLHLVQETYPRRKVIVWAASFHLLRNASEVKGKTDYSKTVPMGHLVHEALGDDWYAIAFGAFDGHAGRPWDAKPRPIGEAPKNSLEWLCEQAGLENAFIPLRGTQAAWLKEPLTARPLGNSPMAATWPQHFDGYVFTKAMTPSTRAEPSTPAPATTEMRPLLPDLEAHWAKIDGGLERQNPWVDKWDLIAPFDTWRSETGATAADLEKAFEAVEAWGRKREKRDDFAWRKQHLLGAIAEAQGDLEEALERYEAALDAYPEKRYPDPTKYSKVQHVVNRAAIVLIGSEGADAAEAFIARRLARDERYQYFHPQPVVAALVDAGRTDAIESLYDAVRKAYGKRRRRFPDYKREIDQYTAALR